MSATTTESKATETARRIGELMKGRRLASLTVGEWDHVLSLTDAHIAACDAERRDGGGGNGYAYGHTTRAKWAGYRARAARRTR